VNYQIANCRRCGREFEQHRAGHIYCSRECRWGTDHPERRPVDVEQLERLFAKTRNPRETVRDDDWHPTGGVMKELDCWDTVAKRRQWYLNLRDEGLVYGYAPNE
jgi:hypothetical protein